MGQMTEATFKTLYDQGKLVYNKAVSVAEAVKKACETSPEVAASSAEHYINWYSRMREGKFLSWNTNAKLLVYYVKRVIEEEDSHAAELAIKASREYAKYKNRVSLENELIELANEKSIALIELDDIPESVVAFDYDMLGQVLNEYKDRFVSNIWPDENYKWMAVKCFQDNWDINAPDFTSMLSRSLEKTENLLSSVNYFPMGMILGFSKSAPEEVRAMFISLFDESKDVFERINEFKQKSAELLDLYGDGAAQHYQNENAISTYLWLRYPDKYYIYKYSEVKTVALVLRSGYKFKKGAYADNIRNFLKLYDEISVALKEDTELVEMFTSQLNDACYPDPELRTLTIDIGFYISRHFAQEQDEDFDETDPSLFSDDWFPSLSEYNPGFDKDQWLSLLNNKKIIGPVWGGVLAAFYGFGGAATCTQIAQRYNKTASGISGNCTQLAKAIYKNTQCPLSTRDNGKSRYWPILFQGKKADSDTEGGYIWKLRPELFEALTEFDIMRFQWDSSLGDYDEEAFLKDVFMTKEKYSKLVSVLKMKKNIILQGAPGVGKTFAAKRLAYSMMGSKDDSRIEFVQFHQNYSYEDFVMGYKPTDTGFALKPGIFYEFCKKASGQPGKDFFFIIDEINRGNMSKIFGELLMLIEKDYRGTEVTLAYNGQSFTVPENLFIIGMMNTADRSLAMIDYALRRRFSFFEMSPGFETEGFINYQHEKNNDTFDELIRMICDLNKEISSDKSLGKGFCIGHSYFCNIDNCTDDLLESIVNYEIIPMLEEYWFDDDNKLKRWSNTLLGVFNG